MNNKDMFFRLFASCVPVNGIKNSLIYDFQRNDVYEISNEIYDIIPVIEENSFYEIKKENKELSQFLKKLVNDEIGFFCREPHRFPKLNTKFEKKGQFEEKLEQIKSLEKSIKEKADRLSEINAEIDKSEPELKDNISLFNEYFSYYSKQLYNEEFVLSHYVDKDIYKLRIDNLDANTGDGKKKVQIAAFDLAYIAFTKEIGLKSLSFEMHDRIEGIHSHQLSTLFELVNSDKFNGQYIVSVLKVES